MGIESRTTKSCCRTCAVSVAVRSFVKACWGVSLTHAALFYTHSCVCGLHQRACKGRMYRTKTTQRNKSQATKVSRGEEVKLTDSICTCIPSNSFTAWKEDRRWLIWHWLSSAGTHQGSKHWKMTNRKILRHVRFGGFGALPQNNVQS